MIRVNLLPFISNCFALKKINDVLNRGYKSEILCIVL